MNILDFYYFISMFLSEKEINNSFASKTDVKFLSITNFNAFFIREEMLCEKIPSNFHRPDRITRYLTTRYLSVVTVDPASGRTRELPFSQKADAITVTDTTPWLYYCHLDTDGQRKILHLHRFDCFTGEDRAAIAMEGTCTFGVHDTLLVGLDDRHALIFDSSPGPRLGWFFQTRLLVDFDDGRTYPVPEDLDGDSLARLQDVWLCGPGSDTLILKTGRIQWQEKENFWCQNDTVYTDQMETIAFCRTGDLIRSIKAGRAIPWTIVDRSDRSSALNVLESDRQYLYYWKKDFRSGVTLLTHFPLGRSAKPDDLQRYPFAEREWWWTWFRGGEGYGVRCTKNGATELVRLRDRQPLFRTLGEKAVYTDGDHVLTSEWPADPDKRGVRFRLRRRSDGEVLEEWNNRYYAYHSYDDRVVLY